jgi:hypothetical protein
LRALADYDIREEMGVVEVKQHIETSKQLMGDLRRIGPKPSSESAAGRHWGSYRQADGLEAI